MRLNTDGRFSYREDHIERTSELFDCNKTKGLITAAKHAVADADAKRELAEWLLEEHRAGRLSDDQLETIVEIFAPTFVGVELDVERSGDVDVDTQTKG